MMTIPALRFAARLALLAGLALGFTDAMAEVLYKLVDKDGKVAYTQSVPANFDGQVVRIEIDPATNTAPAPTAAAEKGVRAQTENERIIRRRPPNNDDAIQAARTKVQAAQAAFDYARDNSTPDDWQYVNRDKNPQGIRRFPKPEYEARLAALERNVKLAEEELQKAERGA